VGSSEACRRTRGRTAGARGVGVAALQRSRGSVRQRPVLFDNGTLRLLGSDGFPAEAKRHAAADLTAAAADGALSVPVGAVLPLDGIAAAHDRVDAGATGRVLLALP
jgi:NADPH:quinone reductase